MSTFKIGDRVWTNHMGVCSISFLSGRYVGLVTQSGQKSIANIESSELRLALPSDDYASIMQAVQKESEALEKRPTFFAHPDEDWQAQGGHLGIYDNNEDDRFINALKDIIQNATHLPIVEEAENMPLMGDVNFEKAMYLAGFMPDTADGNKVPELISILAKPKEQERMAFASLYPYWQPDVSFDFTLAEVLVWSAGLEANLVGNIDGTDYAFFDLRFLSNRYLYQSGETYHVRLAAHAYTMKPDDLPMEMTIEQDFDKASAMAWLNDSSVEDEMTINIKLGNMIMAKNVENGQDDYQFRGQIASILEREFLGVACYECRVQIHQDSLPIPLMLPMSKWESDQPPSVGQQVTGAFWLTGEVIAPSTKVVH